MESECALSAFKWLEEILSKAVVDVRFMFYRYYANKFAFPFVYVGCFQHLSSSTGINSCPEDIMPDFQYFSMLLCRWDACFRMQTKQTLLSYVSHRNRKLFITAFIYWACLLSASHLDLELPTMTTIYH